MISDDAISYGAIVYEILYCLYWQAVAAEIEVSPGC
jgi:hypothetical protein